MYRRFNQYFVLFVLLIFFLIFPAEVLSQFLGYKILGDRKRVKIPFEIYNNLVVVPVKLNGIIPLNFVVDTGVRSSIITDRYITDVLRIPYSRKITVNGPGDYVILEAYVVTDVDIVLQGVVGTDQSVLVLKEDYLQLRNYLGAEVHGLIGHDLFTRFVVEINYAKKILTLHEPENYKPRKKYKKIPLSVEDTKPYIYADVKISDSSEIHGKFMLDTGASHAVLINQNSDANVIVPNKYIESDIGRGLGGPISGKIAPIIQISFDNFRFRNLVASFPDPDSYPDTVGLVFRNGTIGGELLSRFTATFDYFNKKLYLRKNQKYSKTFGYNMSGLTVAAEGTDLKSYKITNVLKGSPADLAGIQNNDYIQYINGIDIDNIELNEIYQLFNYKDGKKISMYITRGKKTMRKKFRLDDFLGIDN